MPYVKDKNGNHILDENGNKIEYKVEYSGIANDWYVHKEPIHLNRHLDTENRHLVIKDGITIIMLFQNSN